MPMMVPAKLLAMSTIALCSPEKMKPLHPQATVSSTKAEVGLSPENEAPGLQFRNQLKLLIELP